VKLVAAHMTHACGPYSIERFLEGKPPAGVALFHAFVALVKKAGPFDVAPAKTRVAFQVRVRFASVNAVTHRGIRVHLVLPRRLKSRRITRVEHLGNVWVHHLAITKRGDLDDELLRWIRAARREYGMV
jgi:hypothetical protein